MPPLLRTYFNPSHRSFLQTLFCATFLASLTIAAFPCPVRTDGNGRISNDSEGDAELRGVVQGTRAAAVGKAKTMKDEIVVMMNERGGRRRFMDED